MTQGAPTELVIVRRRPPLFPEAAKGGVWKIAYADFMTAMMAFFLVMWLINVTDESVKKGVAQYFNPVNLAATSPNRRGLNDPDKTGETNEDGKNQPLGNAGTEEDYDKAGKSSGEGAGTGRARPGGEFVQAYSEEALFADPYAVLAKLSNSVPGSAVDGSKPEKVGFGIKAEKGAQGGDAYRDPFDPLYWQFTPQGEAGAGKTAERTVALADKEDASDVTVSARDTALMPARKPVTGSDAGTVPEPGTGDSPQVSARDAAVAGKPGSGDGGLSAGVAQGSDAGTGSSDTARAGNGKGAGHIKVGVAETEKRLRAQLAAIAGGPLGDVAARVTVERGDEGLLISLTDAKNFGMFAIGSAEPRPQLVALMEEIGKTLTASKGGIIIRGHTDARPFHSRTYDNWRLSTARAHIAYYMLMRGGFDPKRVERVEGYADHHLKVKDDPYAASNRRIEILLKGETA